MWRSRGPPGSRRTAPGASDDNALLPRLPLYATRVVRIRPSLGTPKPDTRDCVFHRGEGERRHHDRLQGRARCQRDKYIRCGHQDHTGIPGAVDASRPIQECGRQRGRDRHAGSSRLARSCDAICLSWPYADLASPAIRKARSSTRSSWKIGNTAAMMMHPRLRAICVREANHGDPKQGTSGASRTCGRYRRRKGESLWGRVCVRHRNQKRGGNA